MLTTIHEGNFLRRSGPAIAVVALHIGVLYVLATTMGVIRAPDFVQPLQAVFIPESVQSEPEVPEVKPDIAKMEPTDQPMPELNLDEVVAPPTENVMPASESAIAATAASGAPAQDLKTSTRVEPIYPAQSRRLGEEGTVKLRILVDTSGRPKQIQVLASSGFPHLDQAAQDAVRRWKFVAATDGTRAVEAWTQVGVTFRLTDKERQAAK